MTAVRLDPLELAAGVPLGMDMAAPRLPEVDRLTPREALEEEVLAALRRPPCVVSFSGGRDSSAILALATSVARREGLPEPIALTWRFPAIASTHETEWQEIVIDHLALDSWERLSFNEELELLGDIATDGLLTHGMLWPPNLHLHVPALDRANGGSMVSGWDGDGALGGFRFWRAQAVLRGRVPPEARDILRIGLALSPDRVRRRIHAGTQALAVHFPWLTATARRQTIGRYLEIPSPGRYDRWIAAYSRQRYLQVAMTNLDRLAHPRGVIVHHPLAAGRFLSALSRLGGAEGFGATRGEVMRTLFADLLPDAVLTRTTKADFGPAIWGSRARAFAVAWDGVGFEHDLVDPVRLRAAWCEENPRYGSSTLLQAAWLKSREAQSRCRSTSP